MVRLCINTQLGITPAEGRRPRNIFHPSWKPSHFCVFVHFDTVFLRFQKKLDFVIFKKKHKGFGKKKPKNVSALQFALQDG